MSISRMTITGLAAAISLSVSLVAQNQSSRTSQPMPMGDMPTSTMKSTMTVSEKIANAMSAAPTSISMKATIFDWPTKEGAEPPVLRAGTNGFSCFPDMLETKGNDPMCLDKTWMTWVAAYLAHQAPTITTPGFGYMIGGSGAWSSNTDPYAMAETKDNHWGLHQPHVMVLVPDLKSLESTSTDPMNGGPYVMFAGTPYAHVMVPIKATTMGKMSPMSGK